MLNNKVRFSEGKKISVVIPTLNEEDFIVGLLSQLKKINQISEVILVDGGSTDQTIALAEHHGAKVLFSEAKRSIQMNKGARKAIGDYILFLHSDVRLPHEFGEDLSELIRYEINLANFRLSFIEQHFWLKVFAFFTRFRSLVFQFGDQGLWVSRELYFKVGGFNESLSIVEDQEILKRLMKFTSLTKRKLVLEVSARKYEKNGILRLQVLYTVLYFGYVLGLNPDYLKRKYKQWVS